MHCLRPSQIHMQYLMCHAIQNTVVQSIELQGNRGGTGKSRQNSRGTGIAKLASAAPLMTVQLTAITGAEVVPPAIVVPPRRHHFSWRHPYSYCQGVYSNE